MSRRIAAALLWRDLRIDLSYRVPWVMDVIGLVSLLAIYFYIVRYTHAHAPGSSVNFFTYIVPGLALARFQFGLTRTVASLDREQSSGTLEFLLGAPARPWMMLAAATLYELVRSLIMALVVLALGRWLFGAGLTLGPRSWLALALGLIGAAAFFMALTGLTSGCLIAFKLGLPVTYVLAAVVPVVSGMYFSPHVLPHVLQDVTRVFPLTLAVEVVRAGVVSAAFPLGKVLLMLATVSVCLLLSAVALQAAVNRAQRLGTLGQY